jgi:choice-of-anchor C domain-containing protein
MRTKIIQTLHPILTGLLILAGHAQGQTVTNGGFEVGPSPGSATTVFAVDSSAIAGWTVLSGSVDYLDGRWVTAQGSRCIDLVGSSAGTIAQTISGFDLGGRYRLTFLMAGNPEGGPTTKSLRASIGSASQVFTFNGAGRAPGDMGWSSRTLDFIATNSTLTLRFDGLDGGIYGAALDAVSIQVAPLLLSIRCSEAEVCWNSTSNLNYQVQYQSLLTTNMWVDFGPPITAFGTNTCIQDAIPVGSPQRFYQVIRLEP